MPPSPASPPPRLAILGIGSELHGDDAAGVLLARRLQKRLAGQEHILVLDGGPAPESMSGKLRRFAPQLILMIDAAHLGEKPGVLRYLDWRQTSGLSASSHTLPLHVLASYLSAELNDPAIGLLGIQPASTDFGAPLSPGVAKAIDLAEQCLVSLIRHVRP